MHVVATAGHVDHGKSTLVRALTGMEPDRWAEERRRGMTIDLGFAWTSLPSGREVAFVDVPGHERFVTNMLAGVGAAPAALLVVAADEGWMPQTEEHMVALAELGSADVMLVVTKCDLAPAAPVRSDALGRLAGLGFADVPWAEVSAANGSGLDVVRGMLDGALARQPAPVLDAPVRLWMDRAFTVRGAGTVVTGTLGAGRMRIGDRLVLIPGDRKVDVRGLQSLHRDCVTVEAQARVAVNLRGVAREDVARGMALVTPDAWTMTAEVDVVSAHDALPAQVVVHIGAAAVPARQRRLGAGAMRLSLASPLPLHVGDRLLLRDPAGRRVAGVTVAEVSPQPLHRRGDAARLAAHLRTPADAAAYVGRRGVCPVSDVQAAGFTIPTDGVRRIGSWLLSAEHWQHCTEQLQRRLSTPLAATAGVPVAALAGELDLPSPEIVVAIAADLPEVTHDDGRLRRSAAPDADAPGLAALLTRLHDDPLDAPDAAELAALDIDRIDLGVAVRRGRLLRLTDGIYVAASAPQRATELLADLPEPFTVADARVRLSSSRRVVVPLLEHLDAMRMTRRLADGRRVLVRSKA